MSSSTKSLAKLTSLSTQTLSLLLDQQRSASVNHPSQSTIRHPSQITQNLRQLRTGILDLEDQNERPEAVSLLRGQYERMRGMLGGLPEGISVESLDPSVCQLSSFPSSNSDILPRAPSPQMVLPPTPPSKNSGEFQYTPYNDDDPDTSPLLEDSELVLQQRVMMHDQGARLDQLSQSINRQHHLSIQINDELEIHSGLLEELDTDIDRTHHRLTSARRRLGRVAKGAKENSSVVAISVIIFVLLILIIVFKT